MNPGDECSYRMYDGQIVDCRVIKRWWFMRLIEWSVHDLDDNTHYITAGWRPVWRLYEHA